MTDDPTGVPAPPPAGDEPPPLPAAPRAWGDDDPPVPVPAPAEAPAPRRTGLVLALAGLVVVAIVAVVLVVRDGGGTLPDHLAGQARVTEGPTADLLESLGDMEVRGVSFDVAMYGPPLNPTYMVMTFEGDLPGGSQGWDPLESTCRHASLSIL